MSYYVNPHGHQCPWYPYSELLGYPNANWCEEVSCFWISEPVNTYSSLSFIFIAFGLFYLLSKKNHPDLKQYLNTLLLVGVFSIFYHSSLSYLSELLAHGIIYTFFGGMIAKNLTRQGKLNYSQRTKFLIGYVISFLIINYILYSQFLTTQVLIPVNYLLYILSEFMCRKYEEEKPKYHYLLVGFVVLIVAEAFSSIDLLKIYCNPKSTFFHGHALWHILAGISFAFAFLHIYQVYPFKKEESEIDFDNYVDEYEEDEIEQAKEKAEQEYHDEKEQINTPQFDSVLDLEPEDDEIIEDESVDEEDDTQIQFDFDTPATEIEDDEDEEDKKD